MFFYWLCWIIAWLPLKIFFPTKVVGKKNIPKKGKAILVCNHLTNLDPVLLDINFSRRPYVMAKAELFKNKIIGAALKSYGGIPVDRKNVGLSTIKTVLDLLKKEELLLIFPEGTRNKLDEEDMLAMKNGVAMFGLKSGAPIIPLWITRRPKLFRKTEIIIGNPFSLTEFQEQKLSKENLEIASKKITEKMYELRDGYKQKLEQKVFKKNKNIN